MSRKVPEELNLRMNTRTDEVRGELIAYLDKAYKAGHFRVFIIHGKGQGGDGTGPVRREVQRLLKHDPGVGQYVYNFFYARSEHGGEGATQVNLRH